MYQTVSIPVVKNHLYFLILLSVILAIPSIAIAKNENAGPLCTYRDLDKGNIVKFRCDRFQSKGDIDSITPQIKIVSPNHGDVSDYSSLTDSNGNGAVELPIKLSSVPTRTTQLIFRLPQTREQSTPSFPK